MYSIVLTSKNTLQIPFLDETIRLKTISRKNWGGGGLYENFNLCFKTIENYAKTLKMPKNNVIKKNMSYRLLIKKQQ